MAETYHGTEIPEDIWLSWIDPNSSEAAAWRRGVRAARGVCCAGTPEDERLEKLAAERDAAEQAAFEEQHKDEPWMKARQEFRRIMEDGRG
jgi:hypothetical protein